MCLLLTFSSDCHLEMSNAQKLILAAAMLFIVCFESGVGLNCYDCTFCNTPRGNQTCSSDMVSCYTDNTVIFGRNLTWRGCSKNPASATCDTKLDRWGYKGVTSCRCEGSMCNSFEFSYAQTSAAVSVSLLVALLMAAVSLLN